MQLYLGKQTILFDNISGFLVLPAASMFYNSMEKNKPPSDIQLPPGFRFHPSDEELIVHYLRNKVTSNPLPASIIAEIDLYKYNPWDLPKKALFGEEEWYFFTPRDRKYPNGARPNRAAASGFWKATGTDKPILTSCGMKSIGVKKALVFYRGRPPKGCKTDWIMHEYRLLDTTTYWTAKRKGSMRLDDWVLCRVRQKSSNTRNSRDDRNGYSYEAAAGFLSKVNEQWPMNNTNPNIEMVKSYLYNDCPMLPYIFASQDFPNCINMDLSSSISFQDSDKSCLAAYDETSLLNPMKRIKLMEKNESADQQEEVLLSDSTEEMKIYETDHSEGNNFSTHDHQWSSIMQYQELNNLDYTGRDWNHVYLNMNSVGT